MTAAGPGAAELDAAELDAAERELGVSFPAEYRAHLLAGSPGRAVFRPYRSAAGWTWGGALPTRIDLLAEPFPHPDSYAEADLALDAREPRPGDFAEGQAHLAAWRAWDLECEEWEGRKTAGAVVLEEHGCGFATLLAVTGPLAGTVWWDGRATCDRIVPLSTDHLGGAGPVTFGAWVGPGSWELLPPGWS
ncbi:SMI1/KNR4 family protein [Streptomyces sp. NPDC087917]|uniref:SMI1/KNR4 family protein n=1 Tax=Streptomyces sp. NPDC087917 TaxID=3155060 RepID=UPI00341579A3